IYFAHPPSFQGNLPLKQMEEGLASSHKHFTHTQRIFYLVFQNNFLTNTTSDGNPFFTIASRSI
ncbi:hypothetical protein, partial [Anoxybacillus suryakundensis]|uniref:hypothetical protein n=1 Tax=Anoxybacillus suryakundensis TaxID=1325335 RepID=UPI001ADF6C2A